MEDYDVNEQQPEQNSMSNRDQKAEKQKKNAGILSLVLAIVGLFVFGIPLGAGAIGGGIFALKNGTGSKMVPILAIAMGVFDIIATIYALITLNSIF